MKDLSIISVEELVLQLCVRVPKETHLDTDNAVNWKMSAYSERLVLSPLPSDLIGAFKGK